MEIKKRIKRIVLYFEVNMVHKFMLENYFGND